MVNKRHKSESAQETLRYLAGRPFGVTVKELAEARSGKTIGPYQRSINKGLKDHSIRNTAGLRHGYMVLKLWESKFVE
jgi:hypothetical protein